MATGFKTGGRKRGTPNKATADVRELAQIHGAAAIEKAAKLAGLVIGADGKPDGMAESEQTQLAAISLILDRAYGKPGQAVEVSGAVDMPTKIVMEIVDSVNGMTRGLPSQYEARRAEQRPSSSKHTRLF